MKTLDRYLIREFLRPFAYALLVFIMLYLVLDLFACLEDILKNQVSGRELFEYYTALLPIIFVQTSPLALLLATLYTLGVFNRNNEITALKAAGISISRVALPLFTLGLLTSMLSFWLNENVVPRASVVSRTIKQDRIKACAPAAPGKLLRNLALQGMENRMYYLGAYDPSARVMFDVTILQQNPNHSLLAKITAPFAAWENDHWLLRDAIVSRYQANSLVEKPEKISAFILTGAEETPEDFAAAAIADEFLSGRDLKREIRRLSFSGYRPLRKLVDYHSRFAYPFANLVVILLGIPFALGVKKGGAMMGIGFSLGIGLAFYEINFISLSLGRGGILPPMLSAWMANLIFAAGGLVLLARTQK